MLFQNIIVLNIDLSTITNVPVTNQILIGFESQRNCFFINNNKNNSKTINITEVLNT